MESGQSFSIRARRDSFWFDLSLRENTVTRHPESRLLSLPPAHTHSQSNAIKVVCTASGVQYYTAMKQVDRSHSGTAARHLAPLSLSLFMHNMLRRSFSFSLEIEKSLCVCTYFNIFTFPSCPCVVNGTVCSPGTTNQVHWEKSRRLLRQKSSSCCRWLLYYHSVVIALHIQYDNVANFLNLKYLKSYLLVRHLTFNTCMLLAMTYKVAIKRPLFRNMQQGEFSWKMKWKMKKFFRRQVRGSKTVWKQVFDKRSWEKSENVVSALSHRRRVGNAVKVMTSPHCHRQWPEKQAAG